MIFSPVPIIKKNALGSNPSSSSSLFTPSILELQRFYFKQNLFSKRLFLSVVQCKLKIPFEFVLIIM